MANASSDDVDRERPAAQRPSSSLGSSLFVRALGFIALMVVVGYGIDILLVPVLGDSRMINVIIGIFLSLGIVAAVITAVAALFAVVRRIRR